MSREQASGRGIPRGLRRGVLVGTALLATTSDPSLASDDVLGDPLAVAGARCMALGGASMAVAQDPSNVVSAPGTLPMEVRYETRALGFLAPGGVRGVQATAVDSRTGPVTLGVTWRWLQDPDLDLESSELPGWTEPGATLVNGSTAQQVGVGAAVSTQDRRASIGLGGTRWWRVADVAGTGSGWRLGGSLAVRPHDTLVLAAGGSGPILAEGARNTEGEARLNAGFRWQPAEVWGLVGDVFVPLPREGLAVGLGTEGTVQEVVALRAGWYHASQAGVDALTAGLALQGEPASLEYGVRVDLRTPAEGTPAWHVLELRISF